VSRPDHISTVSGEDATLMFQEVRVAAISFKPRKFDIRRNADRLEAKLRQAADRGAQLALAPEGALEGYVAYEIVQGRHPPERMREVAISTQDPLFRRFCALARELRMCVAFGFAERVGRDVFNCAAFIDHRGRLCGKYHKMQFAEGYHPSWWFNRLGRTSRAFETPFGRCGFLICNDRWNPALARIPVLDGARYLLIPSFGSGKEEQDAAVLARARENGVPIVEANVGVTLIISKGEIVKLSRSQSAVTLGTIAVPAPASAANRDGQERRFLAWRRREMRKRLRAQTRGRSAR